MNIEYSKDCCGYSCCYGLRRCYHCWQSPTEGRYLLINVDNQGLCEYIWRPVANLKNGPFGHMLKNMWHPRSPLMLTILFLPPPSPAKRLSVLVRRTSCTGPVCHRIPDWMQRKCEEFMRDRKCGQSYLNIQQHAKICPIQCFCHFQIVTDFGWTNVRQ